MTSKRGETAAIVPSDTRPIRKEPMTNDELFEQLARDRREIEEAGRPLVMIASVSAQEKQNRIEAANARIEV